MTDVRITKIEGRLTDDPMLQVWTIHFDALDGSIINGTVENDYPLTTSDAAALVQGALNNIEMNDPTL